MGNEGGDGKSKRKGPRKVGRVALVTMGVVGAGAFYHGKAFHDYVIGKKTPTIDNPPEGHTSRGFF